jgi:hypothetical protein
LSRGQYATRRARFCRKSKPPPTLQRIDSGQSRHSGSKPFRQAAARGVAPRIIEARDVRCFLKLQARQQKLTLLIVYELVYVPLSQVAAKFL